MPLLVDYAALIVNFSASRKKWYRFAVTTSNLISNYANHSDIATSAAVTELHGIILLSLLLSASMLSQTSAPISILVFVFLESISTASTESSLANYGSTG